MGIVNDDVGAAVPLNSQPIPGPATVQGDLTVTGSESVGANLAVVGNETVGGTLGVGGAATLASAVVTGNETVGGSLGVTGPITPSQTNGIVGTTTNNEPATGSFGERPMVTLASGSAVSLTSGNAVNIVSFTLSAGDWDVFGTVSFKFGATTSYTNLGGGASGTSATVDFNRAFVFTTPAAVPGNAFDMICTVPTTRVLVAAPITIYLVAFANFTVSTLAVYGTIRARRMR